MWWLSMALAAPILVPAVEPQAQCQRAALAAAGLSPEAPLHEGRFVDGDRLAVVVGVPCHDSPSVPPLEFPTSDARHMADTLEARGFQVRRLSTLVYTEQLMAALDDAQAHLDPEGELVVYFSGHGVLLQNAGQLQRYLVLSDTDLPHVARTGLSVSALDARVQQIPAAARVVVQDTCFAAQAEEGGKTLGMSHVAGGRAKGIPLPEAPLALAPQDQRLYAARFFEQALESATYGGSVYTSFLIEALSAPLADVDGDGCVGTLEAHAWAQERTAEVRDGFQVPQLRAARSDNVLLGCAPHGASQGVFLGTDQDTTIDGEPLQVLAGASPGLHKITVTQPNGRQALSANTRVHAGEWIDLRAELNARRPAMELALVTTARPGGPLPLAAAGAELRALSRDRGLGRLTAGLLAEGLPTQSAHQDCLGYKGAHGLARLGWSLGAGALSVGPQAGIGGAWRVPVDLCEGRPQPSGVGLLTELSARAEAHVGPAVFQLEAGGSGVRVERASQNHLDLSGMVRLGVGVRR